MSERDSNEQGERDPDREAILRRRQRFISAALGGLAAAASTGCPQPCLSPKPPPRTQQSPPPQVCLSPPQQDPTPPVPEAKASPTPAEAEVEPTKPAPRPCLKVYRPPAPEQGEDGERPEDEETPR